MEVMISHEEQVAMKLEYLKELRELLKAEAFSGGGLVSIATRYLRICESIEKDLGIPQSEE
ncbi:Hypothetical protein DPCES_5366 [Desulfitobacterium hafniense]|uniref:Uncharacterized protein n=1 Tax=Desulfitobacterium hafniense TaxID=49338 RepID=A0A098AU92_DESHA|nr:hypothetical protein [Desulfitobacterium hafniense]CDV96364.1 Hypothetical protein DPCES_5366 [Desulfitobacterium hafniense]